MSFLKKIKIEEDSSSEDQYIFNNSDYLNQQDQSTVSTKIEHEMMHDDEGQVASISSNVDETNSADEIQIKTEITVEETTVEQYSEFEKRSECETTIADCSVLQYHRASHHQQSLLNCSYCSQQFHNSSLLHRHMASHENILLKKGENKKFECQQCFKQFNRFENFDRHTKQHDLDNQKEPMYTYIESNVDENHQIKHEITIEETKIQENSETRIKEFSCKFCNFSSECNKLLLTHIKESHPYVGSFRCGICRSIFKGMSELEKHVAEAHQGLANECSICLTQYREDEKADHKTKCLGRQLFICDHCNMSFLRKEGLLKHLDEHGVSEDLKESLISKTQIKNIFFSCEICGDDRAYLKDPLREHAKEQHGGYYLLCPDCGVSFDDNSNRMRHMKKYCRVGPARERFISKEIECPQCSKSYQNRAALEDHITNYHRKTPYKCNECGMIFSNGPKLRQHKINVHMKLSLSCPYCSKMFKLNSALRRHMTSHLASKLENGPEIQYQCTECEMMFPSELKLRQHKVKIHMEPSLSCTQCSQKFKFKSGLHRHMTMHENLLEKGQKQKDTQRVDQKNQADPNYVCVKNEADENIQVKHIFRIEQAEIHKKSTYEPIIKEVICKFCELGCGSTTFLLAHIQEAHPELDSLRRSIYRTVYNGASKLDKLIRETYRLRNECSICLTRYQADQTEDHKTKCLGLQLFSCDHCKLSFLTKEGLSKHLDGHSVPEDLKESSISETRTKKQFYSCEVCRDYKAYARDSLREHAKEQHGGHFLLCPDCGKTFSDSSNRKVHMQKFCRVGPARERFKSEKVKCPDCSKSIKNRIALEAHMARYHRTTPYECDVCELQFSSGPKLRQHKVQIHMEATINCSHCSQKFKLKHELQRHMKSHKN